MTEAEDAAKNSTPPPPGDGEQDFQAQLNTLSNQVGELASLMKQAFAKKDDAAPPPPPEAPKDEPPKDEEDEGEMATMKAEFAKLKNELAAIKAGKTTPEQANASPGGASGNGKFDPSTFDWPTYMLAELGLERGLLRQGSDGKFHPAGSWEDVN